MKKNLMVIEGIKGTALLISAFIVYNAFVSAQALLVKGGLNISDIRSVGGTTMDESYYSNLGDIYEGFGQFSQALGLFCTIFLCYLAINSIVKTSKMFEELRALKEEL